MAFQDQMIKMDSSYKHLKITTLSEVMSLQTTCSKAAQIGESCSLQEPGSSVLKALEMVEEVG